MMQPKKALIGSLTTILLLLSWILAFQPSAVDAASVEPIFVAENATCAELVPGTLELKVEPVADGTYTDGTLTVTIDVRDTAEGQVIDFTANMSLDAVFVKGGPGGNLYVYNPEVSADTGLHAPDNNGTFYGLSHVSFCYDVDPPTPTPTDTPTNTPVPPTNTPTDTPTNTPVPPTNTPTDTPTNTPVPPTNTPTDTPTNTPVPPTNTPTDTPTNTPVPPTNTPTDTPTNTPVPPTNTPTDTPTNTPVPPTNTPTNTPTSTPLHPTATPTNTPPPTFTPTNTPTNTPTPVAFEGCTPGYWKQSQHFGSWVTYTPATRVQDVFALSAYYTNGILDLDGNGQADTLLDALNYNGGNGITGALRILLRAAVAALLNAANPTVDYPLSEAQVIDQVNAAAATGNRNTILSLASRLDQANNLGCPLSRAESSLLLDLTVTDMLFLPLIDN